MIKKERLATRVLLLVGGIFCIAFGVAISIRSNLGTTPISAVPYVLNLIIPTLSVGTFSILLNLLFVLIQLFILKNKFGIFQLLQIPIVLLFGLFIDLNLFLSQSLIVNNYVVQWLLIILACFVMAFGVFLELKADVGYLPGEGLVIVISDTFKKNFGAIKVTVDTSLVALALVGSLIFLGKIDGVREGTIASALFVGLIVQFYKKRVNFIDKLLRVIKPKEFQLEPYLTTDNYVITISRQYGSGGHAVGELIAKKLGIAFFDSKLIDLTAIASGFTPEYVKKHEQKLPNTLLYTLYKQNYAYVNEVIPPNDALFMAQTKVIRQIAAGESCVIVGRVADFILKGHKHIFSVFVHADNEFRKRRAILEYFVKPLDAEKVIERKDRDRMNYSKYYTGRKWIDLSEYDMTVETSKFGIEGTADMIIEASRKIHSAN